MSKVVINAVIVFLLSISSFQLYAAESDAAELAAARKNLKKYFAGIPDKNIVPAQIKGLYQITAPPRVFYANVDGRYIFDGDIIDMKLRENISERVRSQSLMTAIDNLGEDSMIIFGKDTLKHTVTVFTDIDCTYCRKLHHEVKDYNKLGIRVRYLAYPRTGMDSASSKKADDVWCSKDKQKAMTDAKNGRTVKSEKCDSPVAKHFALGNMIGIRGTPAIVLQDGTVVPGYIPPQRLGEALNKPVARQ